MGFLLFEVVGVIVVVIVVCLCVSFTYNTKLRTKCHHSLSKIKNEISKEEHEWQMKLIRCCCCGTRKEREKFTDKQLKCWWNSWCIACENTPIGQLANQFET